MYTAVVCTHSCRSLSIVRQYRHTIFKFVWYFVLETAQKDCFCVRNNSVTPREESCAKQTQVMLLGGWSTDDVASRVIEIGVRLEALLRRYSWKKMPRIYSLIPYRPDARWRNRYCRSNCRAVVCSTQQ